VVPTGDALGASGYGQGHGAGLPGVECRAVVVLAKACFPGMGIPPRSDDDLHEDGAIGLVYDALSAQRWLAAPDLANQQKPMIMGQFTIRLRNMYSCIPKQVFKLGALLLLLGIIGLQSQVVLAQETGNPWSEPYNISKSGSTTNPNIVVDSSGVVHAAWYDNFSGYMYSRYESGAWSDPVSVVFPFSEGRALAKKPVTLISDQKGTIHAFWIGQGNNFYYASVDENNFGSPGAWRSVEVDNVVTGFDVALDERGNMHIAYVKGQDEEDLPAGIYYRQLKDGYLLSPRQSIYVSPYFRSDVLLTQHHVDVSATPTDESTRVFIGWDDPVRNQVSIRRSDDNGESWGDPFDVAPTDGTVSSGKQFGILIMPEGNDTLVLWHNGVPKESCTTSFIWSTDAGISWSEPQPMLSNLAGCPTDNQFFESTDGTDILMTTIIDQVYLLAWNGVQWSEPLVQDKLSGFIDPVTNSLVTLSCRRSIMDSENRLYHTGCDPEGTGDIWILDRVLGSVADWFPPDPAWSKPSPLASNSFEIFKPVSITDSTSRTHVFWTQIDQSETSERVTKIYYTSTSEDGWLTPGDIQNSPDGEPIDIQIAIDSKDRLLLVWAGHLSGEIYFSWASADKASSPTEWEDPITLPSINPINSSPTILVSPADNIFVAYSLSLNENRGIYLVNSSDGGNTWSSPSLVVDAVAAELNMVDSPILTQTESGRLHLVFSQNAVPGDREPVALYYVASDDNGVTWSQPIPIVERPLEWFSLVSLARSQVHNLWQAVFSTVSSIFQASSQDEGANWAEPVNVSNFGGLLGMVDAVSDQVSRLHLLQIVDDPNRGKVLNHWTYEGESWSVQEELTITSAKDININSIDATTTRDGRLITFFVTEDTSVVEDQMPFQLLFSERIVSLPLVIPTSEPIQTPTPQPVATSTLVITATQEPPPIVTPTSVDEQSGGSNKPLNISTIGLIAGWLFVMILVVGAFVFELRRRRK